MSTSILNPLLIVSDIWRHRYLLVQLVKRDVLLRYRGAMFGVLEYAGGHHERMGGKGFPKGLTREEMQIPTRIPCRGVRNVLLNRACDD